METVTYSYCTESVSGCVDHFQPIIFLPLGGMGDVPQVFLQFEAYHMQQADDYCFSSQITCDNITKALKFQFQAENCCRVLTCSLKLRIDVVFEVAVQMGRLI